MNNTYSRLTAAIALVGFAGIANGQGPTCSATDAECLQREFEQACRSEVSAAASCTVWLRGLEQSIVGTQPNGRLTAGAANVALADFAAEPGAKESFRDRARDIYRDVVETDPANVQALTGLASLAESQEEKVSLLRRGLEVDPENVRSLEALSRALSVGSSEEEISEAAELKERAYYLLPPGSRKWHLAAVAIFQYDRVGLDAQAEALRERARQDLGLDETLAELARPERMDLDRLSSRLNSICTDPIGYIVGPIPCLDSLKTVADAANNAGVGEFASKLAEGVSGAMGLAVEAGARLTQADPGWRTWFEDTLESFFMSGIASPETYNAYATITSDREKRLETMEAAASRFPDNGELAFALGLAHLDVGNKDEAIRNLSRARSLLPDSRRAFIDELVEQASDLPR